MGDPQESPGAGFPSDKGIPDSLSGACQARVGEAMVPAHRELAPTLICLAGTSCRCLASAGCWTHIFLSKVNEVLEVNVVPIGLDVVVDKEVELVSNPVLEDKGQDPCRQLQEEDEAKEHGELELGAHGRLGSKTQDLGVPWGRVPPPTGIQNYPESPTIRLVVDGKDNAALPTHPFHFLW